MKISFQVIQNYPQQFPCILIIVENQKYWFNLPETIIRFAKDSRIKFQKGQTVFFTRLCLDTLQSFFPLISHLNDGKRQIDWKLYGPEPLIKFLEAVKFRFNKKFLPFSAYTFFKQNSKILGVRKVERMIEIFKRPDFLQVFYGLNQFLVNNYINNYEQEINDASLLINCRGEFDDGSLKVVPVQILYQQEFSDGFGFKTDISQHQTQQKAVINYIVLTKKIIGKVLPNKIEELKIPKVQIKQLLKEGKIEMDGKTIFASEIQEPEQPSQALFIIDCPNFECLNQIINKNEFMQYSDKNIDKKQCSLTSVIHLANKNIIQSQLYKDWIAQFSEAMHIFTCMGLKQYINDAKEIEILKRNIKHFGQVEIISQFFPQYIVNLKKIEQNMQQFELRKGDEINLFQQIEKDKVQQNEPIQKQQIEIDKQQQQSDNIQLLQKEEEIKSNDTQKLQQISTNSTKVENYTSLDDEFPFLSKKTLAKRYTEFTMQPLKSIGYNLLNGLVPEFDTVQKVISQKTLNNYAQLQLQLAQINNKQQSQKLDQDQIKTNKFNKYDPEIVFLGTGCMKPSRYRTVSCIYIRNPTDNSGIILDCGEGTYYQMLNQFGMEKTEEYLANLKLIIISHQHSDHQYGMPFILQKRKEAIIKRYGEKMLQEQSIYLIIPFIIYELINSINIFLDDLSCKIIFSQEISGQPFSSFIQNHFLVQYIFGDNPQVINNFLDQREENLIDYITFLNNINISYIKTIPVQHCLESFAIVIEHNSGVKIAFSGDCRPNQLFEQNAYNADIYIHEATFGEKEQENAIQFYHTTIMEAIQSGIRAKAWRTILTHFSQRYETINIQEQSQEDPQFQQINNYLKNNVVIAFDHFICQLSQYEQMPQITQLISELFADDEE